MKIQRNFTENFRKISVKIVEKVKSKIYEPSENFH